MGHLLIIDLDTLVGMLTNRDMRFESDPSIKASALMTTGDLITVREGAGREEARNLLRTRKIERVIVADDQNRAVGLITMKDIEKAQGLPERRQDEQGRLLVGAASTVGDAASSAPWLWPTPAPTWW